MSHRRQGKTTERARQLSPSHAPIDEGRRVNPGRVAPGLPSAQRLTTSSWYYFHGDSPPPPPGVLNPFRLHPSCLWDQIEPSVVVWAHCTSIPRDLHPGDLQPAFPSRLLQQPVLAAGCSSLGDWENGGCPRCVFATSRRA